MRHVADERGAVIPPPEPDLPDPKASDPVPQEPDPPKSPSTEPPSQAASSPVEASSAEDDSAEPEPSSEPEPEPDLLEPRAPRPSRRPTSAAKARSSAACDEARAGMRAFVAGPTQVGPPPAWRTHMSACTACTFAYHELVQQAASDGEVKLNFGDLVLAPPAEPIDSSHPLHAA